MLKLGKCSQDISTGRCSVKKLRVQQIFGEELGEDVLKKDAFKHHSLFICTHLSSDFFSVALPPAQNSQNISPSGLDAGDGMSRVSNDL